MDFLPKGKSWSRNSKLTPQLLTPQWWKLQILDSSRHQAVIDTKDIYTTVIDTTVIYTTVIDTVIDALFDTVIDTIIDKNIDTADIGTTD